MVLARYCVSLHVRVRLAAWEARVFMLCAAERCAALFDVGEGGL